MPVVLITPELLVRASGPHVTMLEEAGFDVRFPPDSTFARGLHSEEDTINVLAGSAAVLAGSEVFSSRVIEAIPELRVIARSGVGYDRVDVAAATRRRIAVTITPTANHEGVAEHAIALLFAVAKSIVVGDVQTRQGNWPRLEPEPIRGATFGVFGLGRIGRSTALRAAALGMEVMATEPNADLDFVNAHDIKLVDFDTLLEGSDYLSLHCPLTQQTQGLFDKAVLGRMKKGSVLLNTARGKLVVESDLIDALKNGPLRAAGLDVFDQEPPAPENRLLRMQNVVLTPHLAGTDRLSRRNMAIEAADAIIQLYRGRWPTEAAVNGELRRDWKW